jgi:hypothetical protein
MRSQIRLASAAGKSKISRYRALAHWAGIAAE